MVLRSIELPAAVAAQTVRAVAVQGDFAYVLTNDLGNALGTLQVVSIRDPATAQVVRSLTLPVPRPTGLVVAGQVAYVPAGTAGFLVFDAARPGPAGAGDHPGRSGSRRRRDHRARLGAGPGR